jgi:hypothetical protein
MIDNSENQLKTEGDTGSQSDGNLERGAQSAKAYCQGRNAGSQKGLSRLERYEAKVSRTVLRGGWPGDGSLLPDKIGMMSPEFRLSFWDALVVETAIDAGATVILTEDLQNGQVIDGSGSSTRLQTSVHPHKACGKREVQHEQSSSPCGQPRGHGQAVCVRLETGRDWRTGGRTTRQLFQLRSVTGNPIFQAAGAT